ncbi:hypothetical protein MicloDRAFT_00033150 [Microvirga lotononidis]|uniref:Uncharacterized protein n=1 Tax=Microvirga lotononidis TaxID=864069 RepID=I4YS23_9HYPH|nr:hypothetical protein MicloDRAFT_00033150 [Microvirga lotononidis]
MHYEPRQEREQKIAALDAELARHARKDRMTISILVVVIAVMLALLLAHLLGLAELMVLR